VWANYDLFLPRNPELKKNTRRNGGNETDFKTNYVERKNVNIMWQSARLWQLTFDLILIQREATLRLDL
jgi:hypothetical protein